MIGLPVRLASVIVTVFCHAEEVAVWNNSHHDLAMQVADSETVLGDFSTTSFEYFPAPSPRHHDILPIALHVVIGREVALRRLQRGKCLVRRGKPGIARCA